MLPATVIGENTTASLIINIWKEKNNTLGKQVGLTDAKFFPF